LGDKDCVRVRDTPPQSGLRAAERRKNVKGAFAVPRPERVRGLRVLLVDDVMTTGATADACARALLDAGVRRVSVLSLARARAASMDIL
jgi:predicted amidophosphoribosyltransferase